MKLRSRVTAAVAALSLFGVAAPAVAPEHVPNGLNVSVAVAKSCSSGWTHAVIAGEHKCLRRGQFCVRRYDRQYHRYGFHCHRYDSRVDRYRLT